MLTDARDYLRKMREEQIRDGETAVRIWEEVLRDNAYKLGDELWTVQEQIAVAALDCGKFETTNDCIESLQTKFPDSLRVRRLYGMFYESRGRYEKALAVYKKIQEKDPTNMFARKREIAILKEQNDIPKAIEALNGYLESFMSDFDAWMELADLYLQLQDYEKAAFCLEELIMSNPHNHLFHQRYAEIKYTEGGEKNLELARSYFSQAAKLNPNNMRAQYGLLLTASNIATGISKSQKDRQTNGKYVAWAAQQITDKYQTQLSQEQIQETKVLEPIEKILESLSSPN